MASKKIGEYKVNSAFYSNEEGTSVTLMTAERGAVAVTVENPELWKSVMESGITIDPLPGLETRKIWDELCALEAQDTERRKRDRDFGKEQIVVSHTFEDGKVTFTYGKKAADGTPFREYLYNAIEALRDKVSD